MGSHMQSQPVLQTMASFLAFSVLILLSVAGIAQGICCPWSMTPSFKYQCEDGSTVQPWQCCSTDTCNVFCCNCGGACRSPNETIIGTGNTDNDKAAIVNEVRDLFFSDDTPIIQVLKKKRKRSLSRV